MMSEPKRLHPAAVILNLGHTIIQTIKNIILPFFFVYIVNSNNTVRFYGAIALGVLFIWLVAASIIKWRKFTYRIEDDEFRIEEGLFVTKKRYISIDRIQTMNTSAGVIQQIFKLVKLQIETAGGGKEAEAVLSAISVEEAERIKEAVFKKKAKTHESEPDGQLLETEQKQTHEAEPQEHYRMSMKELLMAASTSGGIGVIISAVFALISQLDEVLPMDWFFDQFSFLQHASIGIYAVLIFIGLFIVWMFSIAGMMFKYANFQIIKKEQELVISRGIIEKHQVTIPLRKIQAIKIKENIIRQLFGYVTVSIVSAGGGDQEKEEGALTILFPMIHKKKLSRMLRTFTPEYTLEENVRRLPRRALKRYLFRSVFFSLFLIIPLCIFFQPWGYLSIILLPIELFFGYLAYKDAAWTINGERLQLTSRLIGRTTAIVLKRRMQIGKSSQSYFQKKGRLYTISTAVKSSSHMEELAVRDVSEEDAGFILIWYSYEEADG
ncbi:PH domain-containing protein [Bacillus vallismortis]|uniref:PH domain-containing protein n=1 Tax=Bacillus vallismortis TaxID=72361 RepID=UPI002090AA4C|nr:PH domain-containing protein [Bacillus vallismortis]MCO4851914.1 PH domain-containing protein [Bacillus vallismortis]